MIHTSHCQESLDHQWYMYESPTRQLVPQGIVMHVTPVVQASGDTLVRKEIGREKSLRFKIGSVHPCWKKVCFRSIMSPFKCVTGFPEWIYSQERMVQVSGSHWSCYHHGFTLYTHIKLLFLLSHHLLLNWVMVN